MTLHAYPLVGVYHMENLDPWITGYHFSQILSGILCGIVMLYLLILYHKRGMLRVLVKAYYAQFLTFCFVVMAAIQFLIRGFEGLDYDYDGGSHDPVWWFLVKISVAFLIFIYVLLLVELYGIKLNNRLVWLGGTIGIFIYGSINVYSEGLLILTGLIQMSVAGLFGWRLYANGKAERNEWIALRKKRASLSITVAFFIELILAPMALIIFEQMTNPPAAIVYFVALLFMIRTIVNPAGGAAFTIMCADPVVLVPLKQSVDTSPSNMPTLASKS